MWRGIVQESGLLLEDQEDLYQTEPTHNQDVQSTEAENLKLKQQIESAKKTISDLRSTNAKLHAYVVQTCPQVQIRK